ncbi:MAG: hypothetical protein MUC97_17525 [Bernardetiaceae bacterium]|nr:hypothetical protein [Bernardetiaceae bacterium]
MIPKGSNSQNDGAGFTLTVRFADCIQAPGEQPLAWAERKRVPATSQRMVMEWPLWEMTVCIPLGLTAQVGGWLQLALNV